jgi:hypothetical protein
MTGIFVSYRRDDSKHAAARLVDRLLLLFSPDQIFIDVDRIAPGVDFKNILSEKLSSCSVLLAVIGPHWLDSADVRGASRLNDPNDLVRIEIETALERNISVVPVLIDDAQIPPPERLPETLRDLSYRQAIKINHEHFKEVADEFAKNIAKTIPPKRHAANVESWRATLINRDKSNFSVALIFGDRRHLIEFKHSFWGGSSIHVDNKKIAQPDRGFFGAGTHMKIFAGNDSKIFEVVFDDDRHWVRNIKVIDGDRLILLAQ